MNSNWRIFLVGLRSDLQGVTTNQLQSRHIASWQTQWPYLPLHQEIFEVSSTTSRESVQHLLTSVDQVCHNIFSVHAMEIPQSFSTTLKKLQSQAYPTTLVKLEELFAEHGDGMTRYVFSIMIEYFHQIGHVVLLNEWLVCIDPQIVPKIAAKFISPEDVRMSLLKSSDTVVTLSAQEIGTLLQIDRTIQSR